MELELDVWNFWALKIKPPNFCYCFPENPATYLKAELPTSPSTFPPSWEWEPSGLEALAILDFLPFSGLQRATSRGLDLNPQHNASCREIFPWTSVELNWVSEFSNFWMRWRKALNVRKDTLSGADFKFKVLTLKVGWRWGSRKNFKFLIKCPRLE